MGYHHVKVEQKDRYKTAFMALGNLRLQRDAIRPLQCLRYLTTTIRENI